MNDALKNLLWRFKENRRTQLLLLIVVLVGVVAAVGYLVFRGSGETTFTLERSESANTKHESAIVARAIDGVRVPLERSNMFPVAVMIDNYIDARPQSGIDRANVVYEALAEGGITRFLAVFSSGETIKKIGPVRSARPYYVALADEYAALFAHVGGSPDALSDIATYKTFDLNQFYQSQYFWRSDDRSAPHNVYTSSTFLALALRDLKANGEGSYSPWKFKKEQPKGSGEQQIVIDFSTYRYKVTYTYDADENDYVRYQAEEEHRTAEGDQIRAKNVIVQYVHSELADATRLNIDLESEGRGFLVQDGGSKAVTWEKKDRATRTRYYLEDGTEVQLNPGTTWVELVPEGREVTIE